MLKYGDFVPWRPLAGQSASIRQAYHRSKRVRGRQVMLVPGGQGKPRGKEAEASAPP